MRNFDRISTHLSTIYAGQSVCFIDPHGDSITKILDHIPTDRTGDVVLFDLCDREYAVAFNPMAGIEEEYRVRVTSGIVAAYQNDWSDSWGARLHDILFNAIYALM